MSKLLVRAQAPDSQYCITRVSPESAQWHYVGFEVYQLPPGERLLADGDQNEVCLVLISGKAKVITKEVTLAKIGQRMSPFTQQPPHGVYLPMGINYEVVALTELELAICKAPGLSREGPVRHLQPNNMQVLQRGEGTNQRLIHNILMLDQPADRLLITEVFTPWGHWSSYPPHKHDQDNLPEESYLEETYYHRINPPQGFAFQRVYTDTRDLDETMAVENRDTVLVPRGYHPVGAPHGYELYYLNVMAGPHRAWKFKNDPDHDWILKED